MCINNYSGFCVAANIYLETKKVFDNSFDNFVIVNNYDKLVCGQNYVNGLARLKLNTEDLRNI